MEKSVLELEQKLIHRMILSSPDVALYVRFSDD